MALVLEGFSDEPGGLLRQVEIRGDGDFLKTSDFISLHSGNDLRKNLPFNKPAFLKKKETLHSLDSTYWSKSNTWTKIKYN